MYNMIFNFKSCYFGRVSWIQRMRSSEFVDFDNANAERTH